MSDALNARVEQVLKKFEFDREKAIGFIEADLLAESAPFRAELLLDAWKGKIRAYAHSTRDIKEPVKKFKKGKTEGTVVETDASKEAHQRYEDKKANFPLIYLLYGSAGVSLFKATLAEIDHAITSHQKQVDGNLRQIRFLEAVRALLVHTPNHAFAKSDWPRIIELARDHGIVG